MESGQQRDTKLFFFFGKQHPHFGAVSNSASFKLVTSDTAAGRAQCTEDVLEGAGEAPAGGFIAVAAAALREKIH